MMAFSMPANASVLNDTEVHFDFNGDGKIDGFDWIQMSYFQKQDLIYNYHNSVFKDITISEQSRDSEITSVIKMLNYYYNGPNQENRKVDVWYTYELIVD